MSLERYYRFHARIYDATRWSFLLGRRNLLDRALAETTPARVLEVGCGTGTNLLHLERRLPGARLLGVDLSEDMLARARRKLRSRSIELHRGRYPETGPKGPFDLVLFSYALTMFNPGWEGALAAARESLNPGGRLAIVDFHDSRLPAFRKWMALNHVRVEGQLLPRLRADFAESETDVRTAFGGLWRYFWFLGRNSQPAMRRGGRYPTTCAPTPVAG